MIILFSVIDLLFCSGAPGIQNVTSPSHVPFHFAIIWCMGPGVMYSCQFFIWVAESTSGNGLTSSVVVLSAVEEAVLESSFLSLLQAIKKSAAQQAKVILFMLKYF